MSNPTSRVVILAGLLLLLWTKQGARAFSPRTIHKIDYHPSAVSGVQKYYNPKKNPSTTWSSSPSGSPSGSLHRRTTRHDTPISTTRATASTCLFALANVTSTTSSTFLTPSSSSSSSRFDRTANRDARSHDGCLLLQIDGTWYNLTSWAKAHPGGVQVLHRFHRRDASRAFHAAAHSTAAHDLLQRFEVPPSEMAPTLAIQTSTNKTTTMSQPSTIKDMTTTTTIDTTTTTKQQKQRPRWQQKLFTKEDPIGIHKYLGLFCLMNFAYRYVLLYFGDPAAGFKNGQSIWPRLSLIPHAVLSLSSLLFHTVPRERVVGKPMIWQEFRIHNIVFGVRSVVCCGLAAAVPHRGTAVVASTVTALTALLVADWGTRRYQPHSLESTTATMPYWEGCSVATQKRFKLFYAYSQFLATLACIAVANPAWPFAVLLAIQGASLLMTLVRKGIISAKAYHLGYTATLILPYFVGIRNGFVTGGGVQHLFFPGVMGLGAALFALRRRGVNKYALWVPVLTARVMWGDQWIPYQM